METPAFDQTLLAPLISGIAASLVTILAAYWFGLRQFFQERKSETLQRRYITQGLVEPTYELARAIETCNQNYLRLGPLLQILRSQLRQRKTSKSGERLIHVIESDNKSVILNNSPLFFLALFFTEKGTNESLWKWVIRAQADIQDFHQYMKYKVSMEAYRSIEILQAGTIDSTKVDDFIKAIAKELTKKYHTFTVHLSLVGHLYKLAMEIDSKTPRAVNDLINLRKERRIKNILKEINDDYDQKFGKET